MGKKTPPKKEEAEGSPQKKAARVVPAASAPSPTGETPPKKQDAEGSPRKKAARVVSAAAASAPSPTGKKTPPKKEEAEGSPRKKAARVDDAALIAVPVASAPSPTVKTPPKGDEAEGSPWKKALLVDDPALFTVPVSSTPSPTGKTPPKGDEAEGSPRKKAARLDDAALGTVPVASEPNPTGESSPKEEAEGSVPKRSRSPRKKSPRQLDKSPATAVPLGTVPESSELIVEGAKGASDENRSKCNHEITGSVMEALTPWVLSKEAWACCACRREDMAGIVKVRPVKRDLLICVTCYDHLCCGVGSIAYPFGHSRAHALKEKHWFALMYSDPESGYCFKCNAKVKVPPKSGLGGNKIGIELIRQYVSHLPVFPWSVGQTEVEVNPKVKMMGKVQAVIRPSGFGVDDLADKWPSYESRPSDAQGYAIRGIPNLGNTCYCSAVLQCVFVLGKLRERVLALDPPKSSLAKLLKKLFVKASAAGDMPNPFKVLKFISKHREPQFEVGIMEDSHDFFTAMRDIWSQEEKNDSRQSDNPTVMDSIFGFQMTQTLSCKRCGHSSDPVLCYSKDLSMSFPSMGHPTKSAALPQTSDSPRSRKSEIVVQLLPADVQRNLEKTQTVSASGYSHVVSSEVIEVEPLEVDSTEAQCISQSKDVVQSPLQIQEGKSVDSLTADSISIDDFILLFTEDQVACRCTNCAKDHEEPSASQSKNDEQMVGSGKNELKDDVGDDTSMIFCFSTLPSVLTLHLKRTYHKGDNNAGQKISGHVRFMEYLDVERFMDPSSVDKGSTLYRLAGVVVHIGEGSLKSGHYIAYVRPRRLGNQQESSSCSSSWFRADDRHVTQVTLEEVLNSEAYMLFYERMEDQDISGIRCQN